jgi:hypothetical protein
MPGETRGFGDSGPFWAVVSATVTFIAAAVILSSVDWQYKLGLSAAVVSLLALVALAYNGNLTQAANAYAEGRLGRKIRRRRDLVWRLYDINGKLRFQLFPAGNLPGTFAALAYAMVSRQLQTATPDNDTSLHQLDTLVRTWAISAQSMWGAITDSVSRTLNGPGQRSTVAYLAALSELTAAVTAFCETVDAFVTTTRSIPGGIHYTSAEIDDWNAFREKLNRILADLEEVNRVAGEVLAPRMAFEPPHVRALV